MYFRQITSGSLDEHIYILGADGTKDVVVIDPGEALQWTQWDMHRISWEVCNGA